MQSMKSSAVAMYSCVHVNISLSFFSAKVPFVRNFKGKYGYCSGNNLPRLGNPTISLEDCAKQCDKEKNCTAFQYEKGSPGIRDCQLKTDICTTPSKSTKMIYRRCKSFDSCASEIHTLIVNSVCNSMSIREIVE